MDRYKFSESQLLIMENTPIPFAVYQLLNKRVVTVALSAGFIRMLGFSMEDKAKAYALMDNNMYAGTHPDDAARVAEAALRFAEKGGHYEEIYRARGSADRPYRLIHAIGESFDTKDGIRLMTTWYVDEGEYHDEVLIDKSEMNLVLTSAVHEKNILHTNHYDYLTGLPTMTYFFELAEAGRLKMLRYDKNPIILFIDLNGMKFYNSNHGFAKGDTLLRAFADLLAQHFNAENCCRFGQDHFAVYTDDENIHERINSLLSEWQAMMGADALTVRIGIYRDKMGVVDASTACDRAKYACDSKKNLYEHSVSFFDESMLQEALDRQYILENLDRALEEHWIEVFYQPIIRAANGAICDEEALSRWIDPVKGILRPNEFIPVLEDAGVIYKLDLYVLDRVLEKLNNIYKYSDIGIRPVPHSINLSRTDFESCDIIEEIVNRVDAAGVDHSMITIEVTESTIGSDFEYMKSQVERFRDLGFPVWMDDFGSGYSSIDLFQKMQFDLIKFDMSFMQSFDSGPEGRVVITELMKMTSGLGIESICEGVETKEQVEFLKEIGCTKLQGYYFGKPISWDEVIDRYSSNNYKIGYENSEETEYFYELGRINLYDLSNIFEKDDRNTQRYFNSVPMAIIERSGDKVRLVRNNQSHRDFMQRYMGMNLVRSDGEFIDVPDGPLKPFLERVMKISSDEGGKVVEGNLPGDITVNAFARRIADNPVNGTSSYIIAILSILESAEATYPNIAKALAANYFTLYYVNLNTEEFIEYTHDPSSETIIRERLADDFFNQARWDAESVLFEADREMFRNAFTRENILRAIEAQGSFNLEYRQYMDGEPVYIDMKAVPMQNDGDHIIIATSNVDAQVKQRVRLERLLSEQRTYNRQMALFGDMIATYSINPETGAYILTRGTDDYDGFGFAERGEDFFNKAIEDGRIAIAPEDYEEYVARFTKENVLDAVNKKGRFTMKYHMLIDGEPQPVKLRAAYVDETEGRRLVVGVNRSTTNDD